MAADGAGRRPQYLTPPDIPREVGRQFSFSRLSGELHLETGDLDDDRPDEVPATASRLDPRDLGLLVHAVLERIDYGRTDDVPGLFENLVHDHLPAAGLDLGEPIKLVERFIRSPRAAELAAAAEVHREVEFLLAWPPDDPVASEPGGRLLHRIYRTASIEARTAAGGCSILRRTASRRSGWRRSRKPYKTQMLLYALAAETITGSPPAELTLCFLRPGLEHSFRWDDEARHEVVRLVNDMLAQQQTLANHRGLER